MENTDYLQGLMQRGEPKSGGETKGKKKNISLEEDFGTLRVPIAIQISNPAQINTTPHRRKDAILQA